MKKVLGILVILGFLVTALGIGNAASVAITDYPKSFNLGSEVEVGVTWKDIPLDKDYKFVIQLENWDNMADSIVSLQEIPFTKATDSLTAKINIPSKPNLGGVYNGYRFIAAFISKQKGWDDTLCLSISKKDVELLPLISIVDYSKLANVGGKATAKIKWTNGPSKADYKLIVQLENWDINPGLCLFEAIEDFETSGEREITIAIPQDGRKVSGCRFLAAFISKTKEWDDTYTSVSTPKDVNIE